MKINPEDYPSTGGKYLEPGDYVANISDVVYREANGKEIVDVTFICDEKIVTDTFWLTREAMWRIINLAVACGFPGEFTPEGLQGATVKIKVKKEAGKDGKMYSRLASFGPVTAEDKDVKSLIDTVKSAGRKSNPATEEEPPADYFDDDKPF